MSSENITPQPNPDPIPAAPAQEAAAEPTAPPPPRFPTEPYVPDGGTSALGLALTLGGGLAAAAVVGFVVSIIGQWFYLVLLFPLAIGLALGGIGMALIKAGKVRNPLLAGVAATLSAVMAMGTLHYVNYQRALDAAAAKLPAGLDRDALGKHISFFKYLDLRAEQGVTLSRAAHNGKGMNLGYVGSYIYWLVEVIAVAAVAWAMMRSTAMTPFCAACNNWKTERSVTTLAVPTEDMAVRALAEGDVVSLLACGGSIQTQGLALKAAMCPHCGIDGTVDIALERVGKNAKGQQQTALITRVTYPGEVLRYFYGEGAK